MIKSCCILLLLLSTNFCFAQKSDYHFDVSKISVVDNRVTFTIIDSLKSENVSKIHSKVLEWISMNFKSSKKVIDLNDSQAGKIIAKGLSNETYGYRLAFTDLKFAYEQYFTLNFSLKDNKYRLVMSDFIAKGTVDPRTTMEKTSISMEDYLKIIPKEYNFEKLKKQQRFELFISKQILENSYNLSTSIFRSLKEFMNKNDEF